MSLEFDQTRKWIESMIQASEKRHPIPPDSAVGFLSACLKEIDRLKEKEAYLLAEIDRLKLEVAKWKSEAEELGRAWEEATGGTPEFRRVDTWG